jgi:hypothetical protein
MQEKVVADFTTEKLSTFLAFLQHIVARERIIQILQQVLL